jgi:type I restriction enzyme S subunit
MTESWTLTKLSEILQPVLRPERVDPTKELRLLGIRLDGAGPFHRETIQGSQSAATTLYQVKSGDFIYSRLFACRGAFGVIDSNLDGCYVSGEFPTFVPINDRVDINFLRLWFRLPMTIRKVESDCTGSTPLTRNRFKENFFLNLKIFLPPLAEQRRIVAKIDELAARIEEASRLRHEATHEVQALLESASKVAFKPKSHWSEARVGDFCEMPQYGYTESATTEPVGPRFLRITDIQNGRVSWDNVPYCSCPNPQPYFLKENDILFARTGATTGKSFLIRDCPEAVFASYLIRLRVRSTVTPEYLYQYFQSPPYWTQVIEEKKGTGQPNVNGKKLANIRVPIPPLAEQRRIVEYLDSLAIKVEELKELQAQTFVELDAMIPSILDKAFKGEL